mmetsp:Transcript_21541/g.28276  ORF Transcript_21541/g.28276 Transcript_21541/m.28276 type:complete len:92 (+) Transcript_21541:514-789(+)
MEQFNNELARLAEMEELQTITVSLEDYLKKKKSSFRAVTASDLLIPQTQFDSNGMKKNVDKIPQLKLNSKPSVLKTRQVKQPAQRTTILSS